MIKAYVYTNKISNFRQVSKINKTYSTIGNSRNTNHSKYQPCSRGGKTNHDENKYFYVDATCQICNKKGHIASVCRSNTKRSNVQTVNTDYKGTDAENSDFTQQILQMKNTNGQGLEVKSQLNGELVTFQLDTGSISTIIIEQT